MLQKSLYTTPDSLFMMSYINMQNIPKNYSILVKNINEMI